MNSMSINGYPPFSHVVCPSTYSCIFPNFFRVKASLPTTFKPILSNLISSKLHYLIQSECASAFDIFLDRELLHPSLQVVCSVG